MIKDNDLTNGLPRLILLPKEVEESLPEEVRFVRKFLFEKCPQHWEVKENETIL